MTNDPRESAGLEQQMLEHYRRHSEQTPSPQLDARILAAAQAHASQQRPVSKTSALSRLHGWWFGGSQRARWSMAFASIATLGIGVGLATRTLEQAPEQQYDAAPLSLSVPAPAPAPAPAMAPLAEKKASQEMARPRAEMRKQAPAIISGELNEQMGKLEAAPPQAAAPFADAVAPAAPPVLASKAKPDAAHEQAQLQRSLEQILQLQRNGEAALAEQQLHTLQQLYPQQDVREQLQRLQHARGQQ